MTTHTSRPVAPADIQNELNKIWESLETKNITRASLFNLIIYAEKNHRLPYIQKLSSRIVEKFPSRVIFVTIDKEAPDSLKTEVSILSASDHGFDVACDYIQIEAGGAFRERVPFVVLPHILPDLPVYLLWAEDPSANDPLCEKLGKLANRIIFDSESTDHLPRFAAGVLDDHAKLQCDIADLNWARIETWRDILSLVFYSEEKLKCAERAKKIVITFNAKESTFFCHTKIQAVYLQAWLACQLNWKFKTLQLDKNTCKFDYEGIEVVLDSVQHANLPPGLILSVDIFTHDNEEFKFVRNLERIHEITYTRSTPNQCDMPVYYLFSKAEAGQSLIKEIGHRGTSEHYLKVLNIIKEMDKYGLC